MFFKARWLCPSPFARQVQNSMGFVALISLPFFRIMMCFLAAPMAQQLDFGCISMYEIHGKNKQLAVLGSFFIPLLGIIASCYYGCCSASMSNKCYIFQHHGAFLSKLHIPALRSVNFNQHHQWPLGVVAETEVSSPQLT